LYDYERDSNDCCFRFSLLFCFEQRSIIGDFFVAFSFRLFCRLMRFDACIRSRQQLLKKAAFVDDAEVTKFSCLVPLVVYGYVLTDMFDRRRRRRRRRVVCVAAARQSAAASVRARHASGVDIVATGPILAVYGDDANVVYPL
jgi:hypothetical protein